MLSRKRLHQTEREENFSGESEHVEGPKAGPKESSSDTEYAALWRTASSK